MFNVMNPANANAPFVFCPGCQFVVNLQDLARNKETQLMILSDLDASKLRGHFVVVTSRQSEEATAEVFTRACGIALRQYAAKYDERLDTFGVVTAAAKNGLGASVVKVRIA